MSQPAPLRVGVVGTGLIAGITTSAMVMSQGCKPVAVSSRQGALAGAFADRNALPLCFDDWRALVASPDIDAVYVATPTAPRQAICEAAARHGKHVLAEKPFASLASLRAITAACSDAGVAFMDATHFVHHPRHALLQATLAQRIGRVQGVRCSFFFPTTDRANVRFDAAQEPMGAIGDMAWYALRALVDYGGGSGGQAALRHASGFVQRDDATGVAVRGAGVLQLEGGCTATWDVGYNAGACTQDLQLLGERGVITLEDFVLDWAQGYMLPRAGHDTGFSQRAGVVNPDGWQWVSTPSAQAQNVLMVEAFAALAREPLGTAAADARQRSRQASERTQALLDAVWTSLREG
jgi:predicted dehydrogenase